MFVRDYMTPYPKTLHANNSIKDAATLFYKFKINGAPVVDENNRVCGLITSSDLAQAIINDISFEQPVDIVMTRNVITISPDSTLEEVCQIPVSRLPVVSADNRVVGILTKRDFFRIFRAEAGRACDEVHALIRSAPNGIIVINPYGIITTFNDAAARLVAVPAAKAIGRPIDEIIPDSGLREVLTTGKSETGCHVMINGKTVVSNRSPICEGPKIVGALAIIQDTSELADIARQLTTTQHSLEALENIFESARQGIIVINEKGIITRVNKAYEDIFTLNREDLVNRPAQEMIENTRLPVVIATGIPELGEILEYKGRQVIVNRIPLFVNGKTAGAIGEIIFKDISEMNILLERLNILDKQVSRYHQEFRTGRNDPAKAEYTFEAIVGTSRVIVQARNMAAKAAHNDSNVLILGESGTGKELFAHAIHNSSRRCKMPFIAVNCAAIPAELLESELFGYEEGSFTGAKKGGKKGKFELANKGTLFLDEIGDMPLAMQAKILRVIQDKCLDHLGGSTPFHCDVRIIAATNKNLLRMMQEQTFREDLFYRLNVLCIEVPPLREREEDIGELILHLLPTICQRLGVPIKEFTPEVMKILRQYSWPGNVRELINLLEQVAATIDNRIISLQHLMRTNFSARLGANNKLPHQGMLSETVSERDRIIEILQSTKNNKVQAAKLLGCHRSTLYEKIKKYQLE